MDYPQPQLRSLFLKLADDTQGGTITTSRLQESLRDAGIQVPTVQPPLAAPALSGNLCHRSSLPFVVWPDQASVRAFLGPDAPPRLAFHDFVERCHPRFREQPNTASTAASATASPRQNSVQRRPSVVSQPETPNSPARAAEFLRAVVDPAAMHPKATMDEINVRWLWSMLAPASTLTLPCRCVGSGAACCRCACGCARPSLVSSWSRCVF